MRYVDIVIQVGAVSALVAALLLNAIQALREHRARLVKMRNLASDTHSVLLASALRIRELEAENARLRGGK